MANPYLPDWLRYWGATNSVALEEILTIEDMHAARRFCPVMKLGVMRDVSDDDLFDALRQINGDF